MQISEERKKQESPRRFKTYKNPTQDTNDRYQIMKLVKEQTTLEFVEKNKIEKDYFAHQKKSFSDLVSVAIGRPIIR